MNNLAMCLLAHFAATGLSIIGAAAILYVIFSNLMSHRK